MNSDRAKGAIDEAAGVVKRKAGELTGNTRLQVEGVVQQVKGELETAWGKAKDAVDAANQEAAVDHEPRTHLEPDSPAPKNSFNKKVQTQSCRLCGRKHPAPR